MPNAKLQSTVREDIHLAFPEDGNVFILNGQLIAQRENEDRPDNLQHKRRIGLWAFVILSAVVAIPVLVGSIKIATRTKPTLTFPTYSAAAMPTMPAAPSPNMIDDMYRWVAVSTAPALHHEGTRAHRRIIPHHVTASKPEIGYIGCPPSVCPSSEH